MKYPRVIIAGTHSGAGKTTLSLGIMLALKRRGLKVQPFKAGPDYIDPMYHSRACGRACRNLDTWLMNRAVVRRLFARAAQDADLSVVEGVMGLYDGRGEGDIGSTAHLARVLDCPVILVVNAASMSRSAAAMVLGYRMFDRRINIRGVILNNVSGEGHYSLLRKAIERKAGVSVLGFLPREKGLVVPQRHLGLAPVGEKRGVASWEKRLSRSIARHIDIEAVVKMARAARGGRDLCREARRAAAGLGRRFYLRHTPRPIIAVARDKAFNFYYQDNLDVLRELGARLVEFSPLRDKRLPTGLGGLYIGGGFPEVFAARLSRNIGLRQEVYRRAEQGMPIYAECGGLIYLSSRLRDFGNRIFPMVGVFAAKINMSCRLRRLGYVTIEVVRDNILSRKGMTMRGHIFHWSYPEEGPAAARGRRKFAYRIVRGRRAFRDGLIKWNVLAGYAHLYFASHIALPRRFIKNTLDYKMQT
ncbi:MAG: cobyrinate a,c-diamide synthase [Candidatus Omnitrophota bacterium]